MFYSQHNAEYTLHYFIDDLNKIKNLIDSIDIRIVGDTCELLVYIKSVRFSVKRIFEKEKNFNRIVIDNNGLCAIFSAPKKYNDFIFLIYKCGIKCCTNKNLVQLFNKIAPGTFQYLRLFY